MPRGPEQPREAQGGRPGVASNAGSRAILAECALTSSSFRLSESPLRCQQSGVLWLLPKQIQQQRGSCLTPQQGK